MSTELGVSREPAALQRADDSSAGAAISIAERAKAQIQAQFIVAAGRPRDWDVVRDRILKHCHRPTFAKSAMYRKPIGGGVVVGPSIRFVEAMANCMGNIDIQAEPIADTEEAVHYMMRATDLETNTSIAKAVTVRKEVERSSSKGREVISQRVNTRGKATFLVRAREDEMTAKRDAELSKAFRQVVLRLIPADILEDAMTAIKVTMDRTFQEDPDAAKKKLLDAFSSFGVEPGEIKTYVGKPLKQLSDSDLEELRQVYQTLKDGEATWRTVLESKLAERGEEVQDTKRKAGEKPRDLDEVAEDLKLDLQEEDDG